jgi:hypothetical protein
MKNIIVVGVIGLLLGLTATPVINAETKLSSQSEEKQIFVDYIFAKVDLKITSVWRPEVIKGWHELYSYTREIFTHLLLDQYFKETNNTVPWIRWHPYIPHIHVDYANSTGCITDFRGKHNISTNLSFLMEDFRGLHVIYPNFEHRIVGFCVLFNFYEPLSEDQSKKNKLADYKFTSTTDEDCGCEVENSNYWQSPIICNRLLLPMFLLSYFYWAIQSFPIQLALTRLCLTFSENFNCPWFDFIPEDLTNSLLG